MGAALGRLGWPPEVFWRATLPELRAAINGRFPPSGGAAQGLTSDDIGELETLMARAKQDEGQGPW